MSLLLNVRIWLLVLVASALGTTATLAYYYLGKRGGEAVLERFPQIGRDRWDRAQELYQDHGSGLLFFSLVPWVGILLTSAAGAFGIALTTYFFWVLLGRLARNWMILLLFDQTLGLLLGK